MTEGHQDLHRGGDYCSSDESQISDPVEITIEPLVAEFQDGTPTKYAVMVTGGGKLSQESVDRLGKIVQDLDEHKRALEELVTLSSHYAELLNMHDGGQRLTFKDAEDWMARLRVPDERRIHDAEM